MKSFFKLMVLFAIMVFLGGCAGSTATAIKPDRLPEARGKSSQWLVVEYGQPDRRLANHKKSSEKGYKEYWEYRKASSNSGTFNTLVAIGTWGTRKGKDAAYVDILRFDLVNNKVTDFSYTENVMGLTFPTLESGKESLIDLSSIPVKTNGAAKIADTDTAATISERIEAKEQPQTNAMGSEKPAVMSQVNISSISALMELTRTCHNLTAGKVHKQLTEVAAGAGMHVDKKKTGEVAAVVTTEGIKILPTTKANGRKGSSLKLAATGKLTEKTFADMGALLSVCE